MPTYVGGLEKNKHAKKRLRAGGGTAGATIVAGIKDQTMNMVTAKVIARAEYVRGETHTHGIESFWSILKRALKGTCHQLSPKHLQRYVDEFCWRRNARGLPVLERMREVVVGMASRRLTCRQLVR